MRIIRSAADMEAMKPSVATIGFFDGVHRGHRYLVKHVMEVAHEQGMESTVITFDRHPREVLHNGFQPRMLSTFDEKIVLLSKTGVDNCVVLPFDEQMAALSAHDFMAKVLCDRLKVKTLIIGYDNRFGHNRNEGFDSYARYGREMGMDVLQGQAFVLNGVNVSSSVIRSFLQEGEVEMAERCLGYPYTIIGKVVEGEHVGTDIGFPTANLQVLDSNKLIPVAGVYAVKVRLEHSMEMKHAMMNIGNRPTFDGKKTTLEVNIFRFEGELYGEKLGVAFIHRLRAEQKFKSPAELVVQLKKDLKMVEKQFEKDLTE